VGPIQISSLHSYRDIQHITVTGLPARKAYLLPLLACTHLRTLHIVIGLTSEEINLAYPILNRVLRNLVKHMAVNGRSISGVPAFGVRRLVVAIVPTDLKGEKQELLEGSRAELEPKPELTGRRRRWPSYYQFESEDKLMIIHVLLSYDLREPIMPSTWWWWWETHQSTNNSVTPGERLWRATLEYNSLEVGDGEEMECGN
jgi:hypothetical protein